MTNTNDFIIDDDSGQQVRLDIQEAFQQLATNNAGGNKPTTPYNHQWFANESSGKLSFKDATSGNLDANYFNLAKLTGGLSVDQPSDFNGDVVFNGTHSSGLFDITFDADNTTGFSAFVFSDGARATFGTDEDLSIAHVQGFSSIFSNTNTPIIISAKKATTTAFNFRIQTSRSDNQSLFDVAYEAIQDGGQKLYFDGGNTPKLATTANGIEVAGSVTATAQPACLLIDPVDTTVTSTNESTPIKFNTQQTNVGCTVNTDKDRITVPSSGTYLISVCLSGHENVETVGTDRLFKILKNGNDAVNKNAFPRDARSRVDDGFSDVINMPLSLNANDYLELCFDEVGLGNFEVQFGYFSVTKLN